MTSRCLRSLFGLYLLVEWQGEMVTRIYFSPDDARRVDLSWRRRSPPIWKAARPAQRRSWTCRPAPIFKRQIYALVQAIPRGKTMTYGEVAARAGKPGAARAVGRAMATNPFAILVPCHRVVAKKGLGGYLWGIEMKEKLLRLEREIKY